MLLRSSEVSLLFSSTIVLLCGAGVFIAGYALQQNSVQHLHNALRPFKDFPSAAGGVGGGGGSIQKAFSMSAESAFDWSRMAYAQMVKSHDDMCDALVILHELHMSRSLARKLLLFPRVWVRGRSAADPVDRELDRTIQWLRKASKLYGAIMVPIGPLVDGGNETDAAEYSIASAFSLTDYKQVLVLPRPCLILHSRSLDSILAFHQTSSTNLWLYPSASHASPDNLVLITPSKEIYQSFKQLKTRSNQLDDEALLKSAFPNPSLLSSETCTDFQPGIYSNMELLRTQVSQDRFNATDYLETTALFRVQDCELPGPEYDAPYQRIVNLRPKDEDQAFVWESLYSRYKDRRYKVCGLNSKPWLDPTL